VSPEPVLSVEGLVKRFGGFRALDGLSFAVAPGEALGLVGPNGSGKTTSLNAISGLFRPDAGRIAFHGQAVGGLAPHRIARLGIARTFQSPHPFASLTVRENVEVAATYGRRTVAPLDVAALLASVQLDKFADRRAGELNSAQQKALDLARALAMAPAVLLLDELAAGLNPAELAAMAGRLRLLAQDGMALVVVEHLMGFLEQVTDRVIVMNAGREIFEGSLRQASEDPEVVRVFLGGSHGA
jgi:branched-chain amino acid transport system ATP-binding protein